MCCPATVTIGMTGKTTHCTTPSPTYVHAGIVSTDVHTGIVRSVVTPPDSSSTSHLVRSHLTEVYCILFEQYSQPPPISDKLTWATNENTQKAKNNTRRHGVDALSEQSRRNRHLHPAARWLES